MHDKYIQAMKHIQQLEYHLGIGAGAGAEISGESVVIRLVSELTLPSRNIFDVGANKGQFAKMALGELGQSADFEIHAFEPSGPTFKILSNALADDPRVRLNNSALGKSSGVAKLYTDSVGSGLASLTKRRLDHFHIDHGKIVETVKVSTLTDYCTKHAIDQIQLLKLDVEGHELDVLRGGLKMFETGAIDLVQFEFGGCNIDTRTFFQDFFIFFQIIDTAYTEYCQLHNFFPLMHIQNWMKNFDAQIMWPPIHQLNSGLIASHFSRFTLAF